MTKDEIKQLIAEKIAGQGSAIDAASVLPAILNGIIDAIPTVEPSVPLITVDSLGVIEDQAERVKYLNALAVKYATRGFLRVVSLPREVETFIAGALQASEIGVIFSQGLSWEGTDLYTAECIVVYKDSQNVWRIAQYEF